MRRIAVAFFLTTTAIAFCDTASTSMTIGIDALEMALLGFSTTAAIDLDIAPPAQAGSVPANDTTHITVRLRYTSCVPLGQTRRIQVSFDTGNPERPPAGTELRVRANPVPTNVGTAAGSVTIGDVAQDFMTDIGSCRTGTAANSGPRLRYTLALTDLSLLVAESVTVTVAYTLTDAS